MTTRVIAIDWSGSRATARKKIWLAESESEQLIRLENGRNRHEVADYLIAEAKRTPQMIIGLDFAFAFPGWFTRQYGCATVAELWDLVDRMGENWLMSCPTPFWVAQDIGARWIRSISVILNMRYPALVASERNQFFRLMEPVLWDAVP